MKNKDYKVLKSASKVSIVKEKLVTQKELRDSDGNIMQPKEERDIIYLKQKRWNPETGEAISDNKIELRLEEYENDKPRKEYNIALIQKDIDGLAEIIKILKHYKIRKQNE